MAHANNFGLEGRREMAATIQQRAREIVNWQMAQPAGVVKNPD